MQLRAQIYVEKKALSPDLPSLLQQIDWEEMRTAQDKFSLRSFFLDASRPLICVAAEVLRLCLVKSNRTLDSYL
jgi:hypothetical protein